MQTPRGEEIAERKNADKCRKTKNMGTLTPGKGRTNTPNEIENMTTLTPGKGRINGTNTIVHDMSMPVRGTRDVNSQKGQARQLARVFSFHRWHKRKSNTTHVPCALKTQSRKLQQTPWQQEKSQLMGFSSSTIDFAHVRSPLCPQSCGKIALKVATKLPASNSPTL